MIIAYIFGYPFVCTNRNVNCNVFITGYCSSSSSNACTTQFSCSKRDIHQPSTLTFALVTIFLDASTIVAFDSLWFWRHDYFHRPITKPVHCVRFKRRSKDLRWVLEPGRRPSLSGIEQEAAQKRH